MKYGFSTQLITLISFAVIFSYCSYTRNTLTTLPLSTGDPTCDFGINSFNQNASGPIKRDIRTVFSNRGNIPEDLKQLYPAAREAWNLALSRVKNNYTNTYTIGSLELVPISVFSNWRNNNLADYQKFFLLLTEYRWGIYPVQSIDGESKESWRINADAKRRLESVLKIAIITNCYTRDNDLIKRLIDPELLPENIEDCYN